MKMEDAMSVLTEAEDLNCVLNYFKPHYSTIFLWGASMGGFISSYVAAHRPQDVKALAIEFPAYVLQDDAKKRANPDGTFPETVDAMRTVIGRKFNMDVVSFDIYCILRPSAAIVAVCERPACGINGRTFIRKFSSGG